MHNPDPGDEHRELFANRKENSGGIVQNTL